VGTVVGVLDNGTMQPAATVAAPPAPEPAAAAQVVNEASSHDGGRFGKARLPDGRRITPLARRLAVEHGIDPLEISGASDTIRRDDILAALDVQAGDSPAPEAAPPPARGLPDIPHETIALSAMRRTIARRLTQSKQQVPHIYLTVDVRLDALLELRAELNASLDAQGIKLSVNDMIIKALALALDRVPECNVQFDEDRLIAFHRSDIAVAVSLPGGLITPVVVDAGSLSLSVIAKRMRDLAERARSGKLQPHEYQGGTASLSNMGMFGIKQFEAVINPPQAMILAVGAAELRPVFVEDRVEGFTIMSVTGSFDHRAIDGADGARLMTTFKSLVEEPLSLVV
jgi:pyruvate dehydrogenase E2 component (dihydrolipoamide acetyltransferase)